MMYLSFIACLVFDDKLHDSSLITLKTLTCTSNIKPSPFRFEFDRTSDSFVRLSGARPQKSSHDYEVSWHCTVSALWALQSVQPNHPYKDRSKY